MITNRSRGWPWRSGHHDGGKCLSRLGYTGVQLSDGETGTCFTFRSDLGPKCGVMEKAGDLIGLPAKEAIGMAMSVNLAEASVGVASINAVLNVDYRESVNAIDVMDIRKGDRVGMIGYFHPVVKSFEDVAETIRIFERNITDERLLPDWAEDIYLPDCDVVVITGVTFINKTIDHILGSAATRGKSLLWAPPPVWPRRSCAPMA
jgi:uncharacterized protein (DUF4213/DUF364 family)